MVALPWMATLLTIDPLFIAAVGTAQRLPWLLFALPAGVLTDRADRRLLMVGADIVRVILMIFTVLMISMQTSLPVLEGSASTAMLSLLMIAFLFGSAEVIRDNAAQTILPSIVAHSELERANGHMWSAEQVAGQFVGPPLAGVLIASSIAFPFGFDASIYALSAGLVWLVALPPRVTVGTSNFRTDLMEGLRWMQTKTVLLRLAIMLGAINAVFIGGMTILVLYAQEVLELTATQYGLLMTFGALGGVLGGLFAPSFAGWLGMRQSLLVALVAFVVVNLLIGLYGSVYLVAVALFFEAVAGMLWNVVTVSYRQRLIPDDLLGRVNSVYRFFGWGAMPFGAMGAGALVALLTPILGLYDALHMPYLVASGICALLTIYTFFRLRFD